MNEGLSTKDAKNLAKASALSHSDDPKDQDRARARKTEVDYKDLVRQLKSKRKKNMKEDWKPEIEHSKLGDAVKKKAEKKRKEAESSLPPHLKLDAMKKAFAHTNEELSPMQDNNLFGNAYAGSKITKKKKKKLKEGRVDASYSGGQVTYSSFYDRAKEARKAMARKSAKKIEYDKKNEAVTSDTRKHGVKFSDKKGTGRIIKGKKHYD